MTGRPECLGNIWRCFPPSLLPPPHPGKSSVIKIGHRERLEVLEIQQVGSLCLQTAVKPEMSDFFSDHTGFLLMWSGSATNSKNACYIRKQFISISGNELALKAIYFMWELFILFQKQCLLGGGKKIHLCSSCSRVLLCSFRAFRSTRN